MKSIGDNSIVKNKVRFSEAVNSSGSSSSKKITIQVKEIISDKILNPRSSSDRKTAPIRFLDILGTDGKLYRALLSPFDKTSFTGVTHIDAEITGIRGDITYIGRLVGRVEKPSKKNVKPTQDKPVQPELPFEEPEKAVEAPVSPKAEPKKEKPAAKATKNVASSKGWESFGVSDKEMPNALNAAYIRKRFKEFNDAYFNGGLSLDGIIVKAKAIKSSDHAAGMVTSRDNPLAYITAPDTSAGPMEPSNHPQFSDIGSFMIGEHNAPARTEKAWCEIIIHEMIHLYQFQILHRTGVELKREEPTCHGESFLAKMREINDKAGWSVTAVSENLDELIVEPSVISAAKDKGAILMILDSVSKMPKGMRNSKYVAGVAFTKDITPFILKHIPGATKAEFYEIHDIYKVSSIPFYYSEETATSNGVRIMSFPKSALDAVVSAGGVTEANQKDIELYKGEASLNMKKLAGRYYLMVLETGHSRAKYSVQLADKLIYTKNRLKSILPKFKVPVQFYEIKDFSEFIGLDPNSLYGFTATQIKNLIKTGAIVNMNIKETTLFTIGKKDDKVALYEAIYDASNESEEVEEDAMLSPNLDEEGFEKII